MFFIIALGLSTLCDAQLVSNLPAMPCAGEYENVKVEKISDDSLSTAFVICIKGGVKHHFHAGHTENVYILEGSGNMEWNDKVFEVNAGDYVLIPRNTVHAVMAKSPMKVLSIQTPRWVTEDRIMASPIRRPHNE